MNTPASGAARLLQQALKRAKETVDEYNLEGAIEELIRGESAVAKLIDSKVASIKPNQHNSELQIIVSEAALQCIKWEAEAFYGTTIWPEAAVYYEHIDYCIRKADEKLVAQCWAECTVNTEWKCETQQYHDFNDGATLKNKQWLVSSEERISFNSAAELINATIMAKIEHYINQYTKYLYLNVSLQEWVNAYNTDTQTQNDPEAIEEKIKTLLM